MYGRFIAWTWMVLLSNFIIFSTIQKSTFTMSALGIKLSLLDQFIRFGRYWFGSTFLGIHLISWHSKCHQFYWLGREWNILIWGLFIECILFMFSNVWQFLLGRENVTTSIVGMKNKFSPRHKLSYLLIYRFCPRWITSKLWRKWLNLHLGSYHLCVLFILVWIS